MTDRLDVASLAPGDRADAIRQFSWSLNGRIEVDLPRNPDRLRANATTYAVGAVKVSKIGWNVARLRRAAAPVGEEMVPHVLVHFQEAGVARIRQGAGRVSHGREISWCSITRSPTRSSSAERCIRSSCAFPRTSWGCGRPSSTRSQLCGSVRSARSWVPRQRSSPGWRVMKAGDVGEAETALFAQPCVDLIRALVSLAVGRDDLARAPLNSTLVQRVQEYVRLHLAEPDLTAARIAAEHHVSVRQLYLILSRAGITLADWIRTQRLEECKRELASSAYQFMTIEAIAHRWGFASAPHFSRVFKAAYGVSPRDVRWQTFGGESGIAPAAVPHRKGTPEV